MKTNKENKSPLLACVNLLIGGVVIKSMFDFELPDGDIENPPTKKQIEKCINDSDEVLLNQPCSLISINGEKYVIKLVADDSGYLHTIPCVINSMFEYVPDGEEQSELFIPNKDIRVISMRFFEQDQDTMLEYVWQQGAFVQVGTYKNHALAFSI